MRLLFFHSWFSEEILRAVCWTLIHSLWQGLLAAVLAGIIIISTRRSPARVRYNLLGSVLILFIVTTIVTFIRYAGAAPGIESPFVSLDEQGIGNITTNYDMAATDLSTLTAAVNYLNSHADLFVMIWAMFFLVHCVKLMTGLAGVRRLTVYKTHLPDTDWQSRVDDFKRLLGIPQSIRLLQSELVKVPVAIGFFKPVILVPLGLLSHLPPEQVETILLHELAHIRRKDYVVNVLQRIAEAVFFFNPALLWISSLIRQEREACCDDIVVANTKHKESYLEALVSFHEYSWTNPGYAMAFGGKKHYLFTRVNRMITQENKKLNLMEKIVLIAGLSAIMAFTFIPQRETASNKPVPKTARNESIVLRPTVSEITPAITAHKSASAIRGIKKANNRIVAIDTVPKEKEKTEISQLSFPSVSVTINDDGKTKTEMTTATDQNGKKYSFVKLNDKLTSVTVDGKQVPESEMDNYSQVLGQIEMARLESKLSRIKDMQERSEEREKRNLENKMRMIDLQKMKEAQTRENNEKQREYQRILESHKREMQKQRTEQSRDIQKLRQQQERVIQEQRRERTTDKRVEEKRREVQKLIKKLSVPTINGREVVNSQKKLQPNYDLNMQLNFSQNQANNINRDETSLLKTSTNANEVKFDMKFETKLDSKVYFGSKKQLKVDNKLDKELIAHPQPACPPAPPAKAIKTNKVPVESKPRKVNPSQNLT